MRIFDKLAWPLQNARLTLRTKLGLAFIPILVCFLIDGILCGLLFFNIQNADISQRDNAVYLEKLQVYQLAYTSQLQVYSDAMFITKVDFVRDDSQRVLLGGLLNRNQADPNEANRKFENDLAAAYQPVYEHFLEIEKNIQNKDFDKASRLWQNFRFDYDRVANLLDDRQQALQNEQAGFQQSVQQAVQLSLTTIIGLTLLSLILAVFTLLLFDRVIVRPLNLLQQALKKTAEGDLNQRLEVTNRDEIGALALSFSSAVSVLRQVLLGVQIGENLSEVTRQLGEMSRQQAAGSSNQVGALAQVTAAMLELEHTAAQIAANAAEVANLTVTTQQQIDLVSQAEQLNQQRSIEMVTVVEKTLNGVEQVEKQVEKVGQKVEELTGQADGINKVVKLLDAIAKEVQLLALNAAIEAASAGLEGERFKTIAREVKALANRANAATVEAQSLIEVVQLSARETLSEVREGQTIIETVRTGNDSMRQSLGELAASAQLVGRSVTDLTQIANQVTEKATAIKWATAQQQLSNEQVILSANSVGAVAQQTAVLSEQAASSSKQLENMSGQLQAVLRQVRLTI